MLNGFRRMDIKHIAKLSRLHVSEEEIQMYQQQLGSILEYFDTLQEIQTDGVAELQHALDVTNVFREDVIDECPLDVKKAILDNFPNRKDDLLQVPGVFV